MAVHLITISNGRDTVTFRDEHSTREVGEWFLLESARADDEGVGAWTGRQLAGPPVVDLERAKSLPAFFEHWPVYVRVEAEDAE